MGTGSTREERVNGVLLSALEGVELGGRGLVVGGSAAVAHAMETAGLATQRWDRFGKDATEQPTDGPYDRIALRLPKGRRSLEAMVHVLAARLAPDGHLWVHGANDEGIKSAQKTLRTVFGEVETVDSRFHGRLWSASSIVLTPRELSTFETTWEEEVAGRQLALVGLPGVFAEGRIDDGTRLLLENLTVEADARVLDFGCGAGVIGAWLKPVTTDVHGFDIDAWAVHCARRNAPGEYGLVDGWADLHERYDHIVSNPPFHRGKDTDFRILDDLIAGARDKLVRKGRLTFVCPATAPVQRALDAAFKSVACIANDRRYRVWEAS